MCLRMLPDAKRGRIALPATTAFETDDESMTRLAARRTVSTGVGARLARELKLVRQTHAVTAWLGSLAASSTCA